MKEPEIKDNLSDTKNVDLILQQIIHNLNGVESNVPAGLDITIFMHGLIVTGQLIGEKRYYVEVANALRERWGDGEPQDDIFTDQMNNFDNVFKERSANQTKYFHVKVEKVFGAAATHLNFNEKVIPLRGKISEVDSFILAVIGPDAKK